jgi:hypothetical protein
LGSPTYIQIRREMEQLDKIKGKRIKIDLFFQYLELLDGIFMDNDFSNKSYLIVVCLSGIFGVLGIYYFY